MKKRLEAVFFATVLAVIGYIMVSSAAKHTERDHLALVQWQMKWADRK